MKTTGVVAFISLHRIQIPLSATLASSVNSVYERIQEASVSITYEPSETRYSS